LTFFIVYSSNLIFLGVPPLALRASRGRVLRGYRSGKASRSMLRPLAATASLLRRSRPYTRSRKDAQQYPIKALPHYYVAVLFDF
jgi:hypothetical protein